MRVVVLLVTALLVALLLWSRGGAPSPSIAPAVRAPIERGLSQSELPVLEAREPGVERAAVTPTLTTTLDVPASCTLELRVVEALTAAPASSRVTLWRIDAPAADGWTRGSRRVGRFDVPELGLALDELAPGRYRALLDDAALDAPHREPFELVQRFTRVQLELHRPAQHHVLVRLYDATGRRLLRVERKHAYGELVQRMLEPPLDMLLAARTEPDTDEVPDDASEHEMLEGMRFASDMDTWHWIEDPGDGFDFGRVDDDARGETRANGWLFRHDAARAEGAIGGTPTRDRVYVGVLPDPRPYLARIELPDGRTGKDVPAAITVRGVGLVLVEADATRDPWERAIVETSVSLEGFEPLTLEDPAGGPLTPVTLVPRKP